MKQKSTKILVILIALILIVGAIMIGVKGLAFELKYQNGKQVEIDLGKEFDIDGNRVNVGPTPIKALGATDQHSQIQLYNEGPNDKVINFIRVREFDNNLEIPLSSIVTP